MEDFIMSEQLMKQLNNELEEALTTGKSFLLWIYQNEKELLFTHVILNDFTTEEEIKFICDNEMRIGIPLNGAKIEYDNTPDEEEYIITTNGLVYCISII